jgi:signal transduction histidine kinase
VHEKTKELEMNVVRIKDMERENALSAERERIMRDMHDGVGGQLVQALSIARGQPEFEPIEEVLLNCLEELRLIVDSIEPVNGDLCSVLGTMRLRMARRLAAVGVRIHWRVHDLPPMDDLGPKRVLDVLRIVQEAVANSLKHARASNITIGADFRPSAIAGEPSFIVVEIADDGHGVERLQESGHGLKNMRHRAESMGGRLQVSSTSSGTTVQLLLRFAGSPIKVNWRFEPA